MTGASSRANHGYILSLKDVLPMVSGVSSCANHGYILSLKDVLPMVSGVLSCANHGYTLSLKDLLLMVSKVACQLQIGVSLDISQVYDKAQSFWRSFKYGDAQLWTVHELMKRRLRWQTELYISSGEGWDVSAAGPEGFAAFQSLLRRFRITMAGTRARFQLSRGIANIGWIGVHFSWIRIAAGDVQECRRIKQCLSSYGIKYPDIKWVVRSA